MFAAPFPWPPGSALVACGGRIRGPAVRLKRLLDPGQSAPLSAAKTLTLEGGSTGTENVLVVVDTGITAVSAKTTYQVAATETGAAGAVSPAGDLAPPAQRVAPASVPRVDAPSLASATGCGSTPEAGHDSPTGLGAARAAFRSGNGAPGRHVTQRRRRRGTGRRRRVAVNVGTIPVQPLPDSRRAHRGDRYAIDRPCRTR